MIETTAIRKVNIDPFIVTWDLGRRCNLDCTYCESKHHNNYSKHRSLDELIETYQFIKSWAELHCSVGQGINIDFTGGEPTTNNNFWDLLEYIRNDSPSYFLALTSNGTWGKKNRQNILDHLNGVTISYHCEAEPNVKSKVIENILSIKDSGKWMQVNLMLHQDYWDECVSVYHLLKENNIVVNLRPLGDGTVKRTGWFIDVDGTNRRTGHEYTTEQQEWFWRETGVIKKADSNKDGTDIGRTCCGNRCLEGCVDGQWQPINLIKTEFENWYCSVNKYFLHIDNETKLVYHHQTCQALYDKKRGAVGSLDNIEQMLDEARINLKQDKIIVCPNKRCGCGMCVPKSKDLEVFNAIR